MGLQSACKLILIGAWFRFFGWSWNQNLDTEITGWAHKLAQLVE
jgi:hypothetical protein